MRQRTDTIRTAVITLKADGRPLVVLPAGESRDEALVDLEKSFERGYAHRVVDATYPADLHGLTTEDFVVVSTDPAAEKMIAHGWRFFGFDWREFDGRIYLTNNAPERAAA